MASSEGAAAAAPAWLGPALAPIQNTLNRISMDIKRVNFLLPS